ncbi:Cocaine esterase [Geodia barretti]|uniref:Cocaine esterase n=1 Tax=Geodia barretti TaxID=519541 RepID=A0AA35VZC3_GEOBA|nr:Cocaine esterase [Geodia barretti]
MTVTLFAATSGADTDFTAKLVDVEPCGAARSLVDGIMRGRYRKGTDAAVPVTPGAVEEYTIDLVATSNVFKAGHRLRLEISSSNFPRVDGKGGLFEGYYAQEAGLVFFRKYDRSLELQLLQPDVGLADVDRDDPAVGRLGGE